MAVPQKTCTDFPVLTITMNKTPQSYLKNNLQALESILKITKSGWFGWKKIKLTRKGPSPRARDHAFFPRLFSITESHNGRDWKGP